jgi:hypothetical protein
MNDAFGPGCQRFCANKPSLREGILFESLWVSDANFPRFEPSSARPTRSSFALTGRIPTSYLFRIGDTINEGTDKELK